MNYLDLIVIVLIALCALSGFRRGLIRTVYGLVSFFIAWIIASAIYPYVARILRGTVLFDIIRDGIKTGLNLEMFVNEHSMARQAELIEAIPIPLPEQLRERLLNIEPDISGLLRVDAIEDYISTFFTNVAINGIAIIAVFIIVIIILSILGSVLDIVGKLPVINTLNNFGGLAVGILLGAGISWVSIIALSTFFTTSANPAMLEILDGSYIARWVLDFMMPEVSVLF
ncbi:MAG: CvpA family protein [Defluviitaleaceae bacterium]|nr:CvpA family protein [Defluviitaleaceae bacterium]